MDPRTVSFTIYAKAASKANSRRIVFYGRKPRSIKSEAALAFVRDIRAQMPVVDPPLDLPLEAVVNIYYPSRRSDLDESALFDALQPTKTDTRCVIVNDRQIWLKHVQRFVDAENPRCEVTLIERPDLDPGAKPAKSRLLTDG
jgi:hypothetical protein